jgi:hypothetical protein
VLYFRIWTERRRIGRHRERLRGKYEVEFEPEMQSVDMGAQRVDNGIEGKSRGRIGGEEAKGYRDKEGSRTGGTAGATSPTANVSEHYQYGAIRHLHLPFRVGHSVLACVCIIPDL